MYQDTTPAILSIYPPPCMDNDDPDCGCQTQYAQWMTGRKF